MNQQNSAVNIGYGGGGAGAAPVKGTAVDSVNANIESVTARIMTLTVFAARIVDGLIGVQPPSTGQTNGGPRAVTLSTQEHVRELDHAFEALSQQINRLG